MNIIYTITARTANAAIRPNTFGFPVKIEPNCVTQWFVEIIKEYDLFPTLIYYGSYSARYFVE